MGVGAYALALRDRAPDWSDVHGLAIHPEDPRVVFVATHRGLLRSEDDRTWTRVGDSDDDLMGFSLHPRDGDVVWTSGHPPGGGNLGVRVSRDGGLTWQRIALEGVDFHAMTVSPADPDRLWGFWRNQVYATQDGGATWAALEGRPPAIRALVAHPTEADTVFATTTGGIAVSRDAGLTWAPHADLPALGLAIDPRDPLTMYAGLRDAIHRSTDGGLTWTATAWSGQDDIAYLAVHPTDGDTVYAASYRTGLYKTTGAGATWTTLRAPK